MKINFKKYHFSLSFYVSALILAVVFFLFFAPNFRHYKSEVKVMVIPGKEMTAYQTELLIENLIRLPGMLSFYEKIVNENKSVPDQFPGIPMDEKKERWNKMIKVQRDDDSSIIRIAVFSKNKEIARQFANLSTSTLIGTVGFYYNIKDEIDLRIADQALTPNTARLGSWYWLAAASVIFGFFSALLIDSIFEKLAIFITRGGKERKRKKEPEKKLPAMSETDIYGENEKSQSDFLMKHCGVPANLPVSANFQDAVAKEADTAPARAEKSTSSGEPTAEELKERLNQLLRGEM